MHSNKYDYIKQVQCMTVRKDNNPMLETQSPQPAPCTKYYDLKKKKKSDIKLLIRQALQHLCLENRIRATLMKPVIYSAGSAFF